MLYGSCFPPTLYGASRYFDNLGRALVQRGHDVSVVTSCAPGLPDREERDGVRIYRIGPASSLLTDAAAAVALRIAKDAGTELIQGVEYLGECAPLLRRSARPPVCIKAITSISLRTLRHSLAIYPWQRVAVTLACLRAWRQWRDELVSIRRADLLFAATQRVFTEFGRQGTRLPAIRGVVPNPVEIPDNWENFEAPSPALLYVGRLDFGKGVASLPAILKAIRAKAPDTRLIVAGGDHYARGIGSIHAWLTRRFGADLSHVTLAGALDQAALDAWYSRAWVVVVPSRWDSCSNVTLEAMARAKPVVVSPHGGMSELVKGTGAPVVEPAAGFAEAVLGLLNDKSARIRLGRALREKAVESFRADRVADVYCRFVAQGLESAGGASRGLK